MNPKKVELHDARLIEMQTEYSTRVVTITVEFYLDPQATERTRARLIFEKVSALSQVAAFDRLAEHAGAGNINYWVPAQKGTTFIYLADGCLAVTAKSVRCELE